MIKADRVSKRVKSSEAELTILEGISLEIGHAESVAITGASGSGKSTLLGLLAGLDLPSEGVIKINGTDITALDEDGRAEVRAQMIGFVFQSFQLLTGLTALENVMLPLELKRRTDANRLAAGWLERVGLEHRLRHYPRQLSGGEQQRVAIARAFCCEPLILFADEPTGNLDSKTGQTVSDLLFELNSETQTTLVLVTHEERLANRCDRIIRMEAGSLLER